MTVKYADVRAHIPINSSLFRRRIIQATYFPYFKHWNKYMIVRLCTCMYLQQLQRKTLRIKEVLETPRLLDQDICTHILSGLFTNRLIEFEDITLGSRATTAAPQAAMTPTPYLARKKEKKSCWIWILLSLYFQIVSLYSGAWGKNEFIYTANLISR